MDNITPQEFAKQMGAYPNAPYNPTPVGGYMDEGFNWVMGAESEKLSECCGESMSQRTAPICSACGKVDYYIGLDGGDYGKDGSECCGKPHERRAILTCDKCNKIDYFYGQAESFNADGSGKMNLTMKELLVLILVNRDWEGNDWEVDSDGLLKASFYHDDVDMKKMRGVLSSLVQKGIITAQEQYVNKEKYTMVHVNNKYTMGVADYEGSINWNVFDCKNEIVSDMGYENFIEWASTVNESIVRSMIVTKFSAESLSEIEGPTAEASTGGLHSPSSFDITWEDGTGQSSASMPPNEIHFGAEGDCDICGTENIYEKGIDIDDYDELIDVCEGCFNGIFNAEEGYDFQKMTPSPYTPFDQIGNELQQQRMESGPMLEPTNANFSADNHLQGSTCNYCGSDNIRRIKGYKCMNCANEVNYHAESRPKFRRDGATWSIPKEMIPKRYNKNKGERFEITIDDAYVERVGDSYKIELYAKQQRGIKKVSFDDVRWTLGPYSYTAKGWKNGYMKWAQVSQSGKGWATEVQENLGGFSGAVKNAESRPISEDGELLAIYDDMGEHKGFIEMEDDLEDDSIEIDITDDEMNDIAEVRLDSEVVGNPSPSSPLEEVPATVPSPAEPTNSNFSAEKKTDYITMILGTAALVVGSGMFAKSQGWLVTDTKAADTDDLPSIDPTVNDGLVASPSTGDLLPADYEEMVVESTGYAVPIIPISLDPSFMGSRFQALPTDRLVDSNEPGIGAHTDVAMYRDTLYREPEQSMVQAPSLNAEGECNCSVLDKIMAFFKGEECSCETEVKESQGVGQTPYFGFGFERKNPQQRVIKETGPISLDPSVTSYLPQNLSGYTGQAYRPPTIYGDMMGLGMAGASVPFVNPNESTVGANRYGSNPVDSSTLQSIHGNLSSSTNASYTNGSKTMSLAQWSIDYDVSQTSDSEAFAVSRSSGIRTMIRRV